MQLLPALESGGVERSTIETAYALVRAGHRAIVVSAGGRLLPQLLATGAEHITLDIGRKSPRTVRHVRALRRMFVEQQVDIVHARSRLPAWLGWWALRGLPPASRPRFVTTVHGLNSPSRYSAIMTRGERVICVSETVRGYLLRHYPRIPTANLRVIPRGIDPSAFPRAPLPDRAARERIAALHPQLGGEGPLLLLPGRGTRLKGHADALALLAALRVSGLDARLWLPGAREAGRGAYVAELENEARRLQVVDAIALTPPTADIAAAYAASDLVLQLSRKPEAFGRTVIEAFAVGRPVLGWAHGGVGELLAAHQPQGAVAPFDRDALAMTASTLLARPPTPAGTIPAVTIPAVTIPAVTIQSVMAPHGLRAMQEATLAVYAELIDD